MGAIVRREFGAYFRSPVGYVCLAAFMAISGWYFYANVLYAATADLRPVFSAMATVSMFVIPLLTMRLFSEEKRQKTEQALLTAPITLAELVAGKFLSAFFIYAIDISVVLVYGAVVSAYASLEWPVVIGMFLGMLLMGGAMIAIGMFISSLTENQIIAAAATFAVMLFITSFEYAGSAVGSGLLSKLLGAMSFTGNYYRFTLGAIELYPTVFYLMVSFLFCLFTVRVFEKRRRA